MFAWKSTGVRVMCVWWGFVVCVCGGCVVGVWWVCGGCVVVWHEMRVNIDGVDGGGVSNGTRKC